MRAVRKRALEEKKKSEKKRVGWTHEVINQPFDDIGDVCCRDAPEASVKRKQLLRIEVAHKSIELRDVANAALKRASQMTFGEQLWHVDESTVSINHQPGLRTAEFSRRSQQSESSQSRSGALP